MATRNEVTTNKLKTGQRVTLPSGWAAISPDGKRALYSKTRDGLREFMPDGYRIVRLNPITGVVSK